MASHSVAARSDSVTSQRASLPRAAESRGELGDLALEGIVRLHEERQRARRRPWLRALYFIFLCALYVAGSALTFFVLTATESPRVRLDHRFDTLGRNGTPNQDSELVSGKQTDTISR